MRALGVCVGGCMALPSRLCCLGADIEIVMEEARRHRWAAVLSTPATGSQVPPSKASVYDKRKQAAVTVMG
jgi:hypothetical protein